MRTDLLTQLLSSLSIAEANERLVRFEERLSDAIVVDWNRGQVDLPEDQLRNAFAELVAGVRNLEIDELVRDYQNLIRHDYAILEQGPSGQQIAIPWLRLADVSLAETVDDSLLTLLGVTPVVSAETNITRLKERFSNVPDAVANRDAMAAFQVVQTSSPFIDAINQMAKEVNAKYGGGGHAHSGSSSSSSTSSGSTSSSTSSTGTTSTGTTSTGQSKQGLDSGKPNPGTTELQKLANCVSSFQYHVYAWGFSVCMDHDCAIRLSNILLGSAGAGALAGVVAAVKDGLKSVEAAFKAAAQAVGGTLVLALSLIGVYIGVCIQLNVTSRGVCVSANWPLPGALGIYAWAKGR